MGIYNYLHEGDNQELTALAGSPDDLVFCGWILQPASTTIPSPTSLDFTKVHRQPQRERIRPHFLEEQEVRTLVAGGSLCGGYSLRTPANFVPCAARRLRRSHERHTARQMAADVREVIGLIPPQHKPQLGHRNGTLRLLTYFHKADSPVSVDRQITMQDIPG